MKYLLIIIAASLISCVQTSHNEELTTLLKKDRENKQLELEYLEQIRIAQENNDQEAFEFYFQEYVGVERLKIPEELKNHPNYFQGGLKVKY